MIGLKSQTKIHEIQKPKLLLHSCCGPCSTAVLERVAEEYEVTLFFYNPNITDPEEYERRKEAQLQVLEHHRRKHSGQEVSCVEGAYDPELFFEAVTGLEQEPEGGRRCTECFRLRLRETARQAKRMGISFFGTTLSVSPHKNYNLICQIAGEFEEEGQLGFLRQDFKKKAGFQRSVALSKEYGLYRQNYCGCSFSKWE